MFGELSGSIVLENMNPDRHRGNWELAISDNENVLSRKLKDQYGQAFLELTSDMAMKFDPATGRATVRPRIAAKAVLGPYEFRVEADAPNHFSYAMDLTPIEGTLDLAGRKYKYSSKLNVSVDITLHPSQKYEPTLAAERKPENVSIIAAVGIIAAYLLVIIYGPKGPLPRAGGSIPRFAPASKTPIILYFDPNDPRLKS